MAEHESQSWILDTCCKIRLREYGIHLHSLGKVQHSRNLIFLCFLSWMIVDGVFWINVWFSANSVRQRVSSFKVSLAYCQMRKTTLGSLLRGTWVPQTILHQKMSSPSLCLKSFLENSRRLSWQVPKRSISLRLCSPAGTGWPDQLLHPPFHQSLKHTRIPSENYYWNMWSTNRTNYAWCYSRLTGQTLSSTVIQSWHKFLPREICNLIHQGNEKATR